LVLNLRAPFPKAMGRVGTLPVVVSRVIDAVSAETAGSSDISTSREPPSDPFASPSPSPSPSSMSMSTGRTAPAAEPFPAAAAALLLPARMPTCAAHPFSGVLRSPATGAAALLAAAMRTERGAIASTAADKGAGCTERVPPPAAVVERVIGTPAVRPTAAAYEPAAGGLTGAVAGRRSTETVAVAGIVSGSAVAALCSCALCCRRLSLRRAVRAAAAALRLASEAVGVAVTPSIAAAAPAPAAVLLPVLRGGVTVGCAAFILRSAPATVHPFGVPPPPPAAVVVPFGEGEAGAPVAAEGCVLRRGGRLHNAQGRGMSIKDRDKPQRRGVCAADAEGFIRVKDEVVREVMCFAEMALAKSAIVKALIAALHQTLKHPSAPLAQRCKVRVVTLRKVNITQSRTVKDEAADTTDVPVQCIVMLVELCGRCKVHVTVANGTRKWTRMPFAR
jgi:hypothetical protein